MLSKNRAGYPWKLWLTGGVQVQSRLHDHDILVHFMLYYFMISSFNAQGLSKSINS